MAQEQTAQRVRKSVQRTIASSTARMLIDQRLGSPVGKGMKNVIVEAGVIDFRNWRAHFAQTRGKPGLWSETLLDGPINYGRFDPEEHYFVNPGDDDPTAPVKYGITPLFLLDALLGVDAAEVLGSDRVGGAETTHVRATLDSERASAASRAGLRFPTTDSGLFPAEVWLDDEDRILRVGAIWPASLRILGRRVNPRSIAGKLNGFWPTAEFWDFGVPSPITLPEWVVSPSDPDTPVRPPGWESDGHH